MTWSLPPRYVSGCLLYFFAFFYPKRGESQIKRVVHTHFPSFLRPHNPWITADDFWLSTILISHRNPDFIVTEFLQLDSFLFLSCWQSNLRYDRCRPYFDIVRVYYYYFVIQLSLLRWLSHSSSMELKMYFFGQNGRNFSRLK